MKIKKISFTAMWLILFFSLMAMNAFAQTTAFSYQGRLTDMGSPANGDYILQFKLFNAGGTQVGATIPDVAVTVNQGVDSIVLEAINIPCLRH